MNLPVRRSKTRILVDGGDPEETVRVKNLVGYVDGQTTNPTLIARNWWSQRTERNQPFANSSDWATALSVNALACVLISVWRMRRSKCLTVLKFLSLCRSRTIESSAI